MLGGPQCHLVWVRLTGTTTTSSSRVVVAVAAMMPLITLCGWHARLLASLTRPCCGHPLLPPLRWQIEYLVREGCIRVLGDLLGEANMVMMALEGLERILQVRSLLPRHH